MITFIQIMKTNNNILQTLTLGDVSSTETFSFRVWNNYSQADGIAALNGLKLDLMYPPLQGITTLTKNDVIKIRCTYSGERSRPITSDFQTFPITDGNYDRLEPYTYNEYEVQLDFSTLTQEQKDTINLIDMIFNITVTYTSESVPLEEPQQFDIFSDTSITILGNEMAKTSNTLIV